MKTLICLSIALLALACVSPAPWSEPSPAETALGWSTGRALDPVSGQPVLAAQVRLLGTPYAALTDDDGAFSVPHRRGFQWVRVTAPGFLTAEAKFGHDVHLWPQSLDEEEATAVLTARRTAPFDSDPLDDPDLRPEARALIVAQRGHAMGGLDLEPPPVPHGVLKQALEPPPTIRLYRRGDENDSCQGRVDVLPLEEYVRGVVPSEWISSWHQESLRAGAIAARTYAWRWIVRGGKYDCADLDDTTRSQVYRERRVAKVTEAVDSTAGVGVVRDGAIIMTEYSAENGNPTAFDVEEPLCDGQQIRGHRRGMCQWGTQRWASQRDQTAEWMVQHYYPGATTTRAGTPQPRLELSQRIARIEPQVCANPDGTYDCADFVREGWSVDLFDLFVGQSVVWRFVVNNAGAVATPAVEVHIELPGDLLAIEAVVLEPGGATPAFEPGRARVELPPIGPGETAIVRAILRGVGYSPPTGAPVRVRSWIRRMGEWYDKPAWDEPAGVNEGQSFNGGELRQLTEFDVFAPDRWTWMGGDPALYEGWTVPQGQAIPLRAGGLELVGAGPHHLHSPYLPPIDAEDYAALRVDLDDALDGRVLWRGPDEDFVADRGLPLVGGLAALDTHPAWRGPVQQLRVVVEGGGVLRAVTLVRGSPGASPSDPDLGSPTPPARDASVGSPSRRDGALFSDLGPGRAHSFRAESGCHCDQGPLGSSPLWLGLVALARLRRRRRGGPVGRSW